MRYTFITTNLHGVSFTTASLTICKYSTIVAGQHIYCEHHIISMCTGIGYTHTHTHTHTQYM